MPTTLGGRIVEKPSVFNTFALLVAMRVSKLDDVSSRSQKVMCFWQNKSSTLILLIFISKISVYKKLFKNTKDFQILATQIRFTS